MGYQTILLDVDGTLLDFNRSEADALSQAFAAFSTPLTKEIKGRYHQINKELWELFERGKITKERLLTERFSRLFQEFSLPLDPVSVEAVYQQELGRVYYFIGNTKQVLSKLQKSHDLYIVTNGVSKTQYEKLSRSGIDRLVKGIFVSEDTGYQKPMKEYFDYCSQKIPDYHKERTVIVGDSLTSDIQGGNNAGIAACWFNPEGKQNPGPAVADYEIKALEELLPIVR